MARAPSTPNRWLIAVAGIVVMICLGTAYSWSSFTQPLIASFRWSNQVTTWTFAIAIFSLGWGAVAGGRWQDAVGPRTVTLVGVALWGLGNLLAGLGTSHFGAPWLYLTYGVIGGFGNGMAYVTPVSTVTKWFPDKRGLASGMVVMGFGLGAFFYSFVLKALGGFHIASKHAAAYADASAAAAKAGVHFDSAIYALSTRDVAAIMNVFVASGIVYAVVGGLCATLLRNPPEGYSVAGAVASAVSHERSFAPGDVLRTPQFYLLWTMLFLNVTAGILIVSNAVPIMRELTGVTAAVALPAYGLVAIFNGLGRLFWGAISDRIGRNMAYVGIFSLQCIVFFALANLHSLGAVLVAFAIVLLCYGGGFGVMPSFNADYFGTKFLGINYGMIITAWGFGGIVGPILAAKIKDATGSFSGALIPVAVMLLVATILPFLTKRPAPATSKMAVAS
ncbi:MAG: OFA family MFS transporter [Candidatus Eremiobacteraeota bacterium]|nr:OFA family MFS transporter [Candidatus Eremiobacteraeota bacterium]